MASSFTHGYEWSALNPPIAGFFYEVDFVFGRRGCEGRVKRGTVDISGDKTMRTRFIPTY